MLEAEPREASMIEAQASVKVHQRTNHQQYIGYQPLEIESGKQRRERESWE